MDKNQTFLEKAIEGGVWLSSSALAVRLISLLSAIIVLRNLSVSEYGTYHLVLAAFGFLASFFISGLDPIIINDLARERGDGRIDRMKRLFFEYGAIKLGIGCVLFAVAFFGSTVLGRWYASDIIYFLRAMSFLLLFIALERMLHFLFNIYLKFRFMALFTIVEEAAKLSLILLFVVYFAKGVEGLVLAYMLSTGIALLLFAPYGMSLLRPLLRQSMARESMLLPLVREHGKWGLASRYINEAQKFVRPWLIKAFVGVEAVGLYSLAEGIYSQLVSLVPLSNLLAPLIPGEIKNHARMRAIVLYGTKYGTLLFVLLGIISFFFVPRLLAWFFPQYVPAVSLFRLMLLAMLTTAAAHVVNTVLFSYREQKTLFFLTIIRLVFLVFTASLLLWIFGTAGAAIEFVLTAIFFVWIRYLSLKRVAPDISIPFREFFRFTQEDRAFLQNARWHFYCVFCRLVTFAQP